MDGHLDGLEEFFRSYRERYEKARAEAEESLKRVIKVQSLYIYNYGYKIIFLRLKPNHVYFLKLL